MIFVLLYIFDSRRKKQYNIKYTGDFFKLIILIGTYHFQKVNHNLQ